jgi:uncharacterized protein (DUF885 family)
MLRMRDEAEKALGPSFDLRGFHEVILMNGSMPLAVLEDVVQEWIRTQKGSPAA